MQMPFRLPILAGLAAATFGVTTVVFAEDDISQSGEPAAVRAAAKEYAAALRRADVDALRTMWTPDGEYVDAAGQKFNVRQMLARQDAAKPSISPSPDAPVQESTLRFVAPTVAIEDGVSGRAMTDEGKPATGRFMAVWVKRDGRWLLDSLRETVAAAPTVSERLRELEWLIGEWVGANDDGVILVSSHWSNDGQFIIREFIDRGNDRDFVSATQRIGWDAATGKIKCWTFDSQAGVAEGFWRRDGKRWIVKTKEVMPNGEKLTTSAVYIPEGGRRFVWEAAGAKVGSESVPPRRMEFKRAIDDR
jgi:uncharacterized protein (TIGR02246 family)